MKRLKEIYNKVLETAIHESELTLEQLANSRSENCVITRVVIVETLIKLGLTENYIVMLSGMSQQRINSLKNSAKYRLTGLAARILKDEVWKQVKELTCNIQK